MDSDTAGIVAIAAAALGLGALVFCALLTVRLRRLRSAQSVIAGDGDRNLVEHASELESRLAKLSADLGETVRRMQEGDADLDRRLKGAITHCGVVRYDAMGEMSGRQSSSVALLDSHGSGVILSSILHREQARLYAKPIVEGSSEFELSPEERQALASAMGERL